MGRAAHACSATTEEDIHACRDKSPHVLLAGAYTASSGSLALLAAGRAPHALSRTHSASAGYGENGAFWYHMHNRSTGFAAVGDVTLNPSDTAASDCAGRLSWHHHLGTSGGNRLGCDQGTGGAWHKRIYVAKNVRCARPLLSTRRPRPAPRAARARLPPR